MFSEIIDALEYQAAFAWEFHTKISLHNDYSLFSLTSKVTSASKFEENMVVFQVRQPLSKNDRTKINTILIIEVHARDIIDGFVRDRY